MSLEYIKTTREYQKHIESIYSEKLDLGIEVSMAVSSRSMYPTILPGSIITFRKEDNYKIGDIVVISRENGFLVHRISKINSNVVITMGDNNFKQDESSPVSQIKGKVVSVAGASKNLKDYKELLITKTRKALLFFFIKLKNFFFQNSNNLLIKHILFCAYHIQVIFIKVIFRIIDKNNLYIRGSYVTGNMKPGISDIDFVVLVSDSVNFKAILKKIKMLNILSPAISFNTFLPVSVYKELCRFGMLENYKGDKLVKLSGKIELHGDVEIVSSPDYEKLHRLLDQVRCLDDIMFKFSQIKLFHPSYLFHNIKKLFNKLIRITNLEKELVDFIVFLDEPNRYKTLYDDLEVYAGALTKIVKKINIPEHSFVPINLKELNKIKINNQEVYIFKGVRRFESYLLDNDFVARDILGIIEYTVRENTYPFFAGLMTLEMANYLQAYNVLFLKNKKLLGTDNFIYMLLNDSIKVFNNYQTIALKDRYATLTTARDIVQLVEIISFKDNKDLLDNQELRHFLYNEDIDQGLDANEVYFKYVKQLNALYLGVFK